MEHPVERLGRAASRTRWTTLAVGPVLVALGVAMAVTHAFELGAGSSLESTLAAVSIFAFAATAITLGGGMTYLAIARSGRAANRVLTTLQDDVMALERVDHLRRTTGTLVPPERHQLRFHISGERTSFDVGAADVEPILAYVRQVAPHAEIRRW